MQSPDPHTKFQKAPPSDLVGREKRIPHRSLKKTALWAITLLTSATFIAAAVPKMAGVGFFIERFEAWGYADWFEKAVGISEFVAAVFLIIPATSFYAALVLGAIMVGAIITHLAFGSALLAVVPAFFLGLLMIIAWVRRPKSFGSRSRRPFRSPTPST